MSKHIFNQSVNGAPYEVQIGWDKPLQQYYANILAIVAEGEPEDEDYNECLTWSDCESSKWPMSLDDIVREITNRGFDIPNGLLNNVLIDRQCDAVNQYRFYDTHPEGNICLSSVPSPL